MTEFIKYFLLPSNLVTLFALASVFFWLIRYYQPAKLSLLCTLLVYCFFGAGPTSQALLKNLEYRYPPYLETKEHRNITRIVVLTGSGEIKPGISLSSEVNTSSAYRLIEAISIYQQSTDRTIFISGHQDVPNIMEKVLETMGVPKISIKLDSQAHSTFESATNLRPTLVGSPFILVTSAGHMPRAMAVFEAQNLQPIPAPTEFISHQNIFASDYLPSARHLTNSDLSVHEHLALIWYKITGKL